MSKITDICMNMMQQRMNMGGFAMPMHRGGSVRMSVDEFVSLMSDFWREVNDGERELPQGMAEGICTMVSAMMDVRLAGNDVCAEAISEHELHRHYHEALDKIRSVSGMNEKQRLIAEHFENLTEPERKVLMYKASMKPKAAVARELNMSVDAYCEAKKHLMHKVKH